MTKEEARELFIDYMYGGLDIDTQQKLEAFIENHADLKTELKGMMDTREMLQHLPVESPKEQLVIMEPNSTYSSFRKWLEGILDYISPRSAFGRFGVAVASFALLFVITASITDMNIKLDGGEFSLSFGEQAPEQAGFSAAQVELLITQIQQENELLFTQLLEAAQEQQEEQFELTLASFAEYLDEQRSTDLEFIDYSLNSLEENTYYSFLERDQILEEIIETVSYDR
ncbi:MAG: hypothetical protein MI700_07190 [Balneolales bacterium]|nr:hypothetical protein [Balneolales bacterium]